MPSPVDGDILRVRRRPRQDDDECRFLRAPQGRRELIERRFKEVRQRRREQIRVGQNLRQRPRVDGIDQRFARQGQRDVAGAERDGGEQDVGDRLGVSGGSGCGAPVVDLLEIAESVKVVHGHSPLSSFRPTARGRLA